MPQATGSLLFLFQWTTLVYKTINLSTRPALIVTAAIKEMSVIERASGASMPLLSSLIALLIHRMSQMGWEQIGALG